MLSCGSVGDSHGKIRVRLYGSRATAGVLMVTTKSGSNVKKENKATISYDGYYGWSQVARMPDFMDGQQFYNYRFLKFLAPSVANASAQAYPASPTYDFSTAAILEQCLLAYQAGNPDAGYALKKMLANGETTDWPDLVTNNGKQQNHYVSVSGSAEKLNYHMGVGYNEETGIYEGDSQRRLNLKGSIDGRVNKIVSVGFSVNLARQVNKYADDTAVQHAYRLNPFMIPYDANGVENVKPGNYEALGTPASNQFSDEPNPLKRMQNSEKQRELWRILGNFYVQLDFFKGLNFKTTFSPNFNYYRTGYISGIADPDNEGYTYGNVAMSDEGWNTVSQTTSRSISYTWDNILTYTRDFGKHSINVMGLFSAEQGNIEKTVWEATDYKVPGSKWWNLSNAMYSEGGSSTAYSEFSMLSYAFRLNYNYAGKYMATVTTRWDGSSKFADGHRWGSFPSAAAAWRISGEDFMADTQEWLSNLKLRASYGVTGNNTGIGYYDTQTVAYSTKFYYPFGGTYYNGFASPIIDKELQWEKSKEFNIGLDYGFLNNRISGTIDYYKKTSEDLLFNVHLPLEAGLNKEGKPNELITNIGSVENKGVELSLTTVNVDTKNWTWTTTFNFSRNKNKVKEINGEGDREISGITGSLFVGSSSNVIWAYKTDGIVSDKIIRVPNTDAARNAGFTPGEKVVSRDYYYAVYGWTEGNPIVRDVNGDGAFDTENDKVITSNLELLTDGMSVVAMEVQ